MERAEKIVLLRRTGLLGSLSPAELDGLLGSCREVALAPGQALCHEGEEGHAMYVVLAGNLVVTKAGKQVAVGRPGDCFGEMALIERRERSATLRALDDTLVLEIPEAAFREHLSAHSPALMALLKVFSERSRHDLDSLVSVNLKLIAQAEEMDRQNRELTETRRQLEQRNRDLERLSALDTLTQIANRRRFDAMLRQEWRRAVRDESPFSLLFCDIDHFKRFNDAHGHAAGDYVLKELVRLAQSTIREVDGLVRYGGEEFLMLLPRTPLSGAVGVAERLRVAVERADFFWGDERLKVTLSLGVTCLAAERTDDALLRHADELLYRAKALGRNRVEAAG